MRPERLVLLAFARKSTMAANLRRTSRWAPAEVPAKKLKRILEENP